jgi:hypothetical protein
MWEPVPRMANVVLTDAHDLVRKKLYFAAYRSAPKWPSLRTDAASVRSTRATYFGWPSI